MKDKILHTASQMFLTLGVKSVTMDDIAEKMGISKKTIYEFFENKYQLVYATTHFFFDNIMAQICLVSKKTEESPIENLFEINKFVWKHIQENNPSEFQLKKYYPDIYNEIIDKKFALTIADITKNMERGINLGLYRENININMIARFYFTGINAVINNKIFPIEEYKILNLMHAYLIYHIRAIASPKGILELEKYLKKTTF